MCKTSELSRALPQVSLTADVTHEVFVYYIKDGHSHSCGINRMQEVHALSVFFTYAVNAQQR